MAWTPVIFLIFAKILAMSENETNHRTALKAWRDKEKTALELSKLIGGLTDP